MEFATHAYAYFFAATMTGAFLLRRSRVARNAFLLLASYFFCWRFQPLFLLAVVGSSLWNFGAGELLARFSIRRKAIAAVAIGGNVALLGLFKYYGFFANNLNDLFVGLGLRAHLPLVEVLAPLGISFYTFQGIAYVVDSYRKQATRPGGVLDFLLFMAFFPKFAAGPICRSSELVPQILAPPRGGGPDRARIATLIAGGLFKKMILGTYLATHMTEDVFQLPAVWSAPEIWLAVFAYTAQIYLDFSGYTDIARGCGLALGFDLPENFRYPYAATNIGEFWRRWHLSLSRWLRDYVYFPLGGSRRRPARTYFNLLVTFLLCGLWHGASWGFVIWGGLHGLGLGIEKARRDLRRARGLPPAPPPGRWGRVLGCAATLSFCALARIFFKAPDAERAFAMVRGLVAFARPMHAFEPGVLAVTLLAIALNFVGAPIFAAAVRFQDRLTAPARWLVWSATALAITTLRPFDVAFTIYFKF